MAETMEDNSVSLLLDIRREMHDKHRDLVLRLDGIAHILRLLESDHRAKKGKGVPPLRANEASVT